MLTKVTPSCEIEALFQLADDHPVGLCQNTFRNKDLIFPIGKDLLLGTDLLFQSV